MRRSEHRAVISTSFTHQTFIGQVLLGAKFCGWQEVSRQRRHGSEKKKHKIGCESWVSERKGCNGRGGGSLAQGSQGRHLEKGMSELSFTK